jgi:hypothetical protein
MYGSNHAVDDVSNHAISKDDAGSIHAISMMMLV